MTDPHPDERARLVDALRVARMLVILAAPAVARDDDSRSEPLWSGWYDTQQVWLDMVNPILAHPAPDPRT